MHGINVPIFSLRTDSDSGIGEYLDLLPVIDWVKKAGMNMIQILPINDMGNDPSPYNALSAYALSPILLKINGLSGASYSEKIDYPFVHKLKSNIPRIKKTQAFHDFVSENPWLFTYARFKALKEKNGNNKSANWTILDTTEDEISTYLEQQFLCYQQMKQVKDYADLQGVKLIGDIPILISPDSADVWAHPEWFNLNLCAGAPPDQYSQDGQKWGFPLYDWDAMQKTGFSWWRERVKYASNFFHYYRIDHIVGFYRIWAIPIDKEAREGFFDPNDRNFWIGHGDRLLRMIMEASPMLPIGEDLGTIPDEVRAHMKELNIPGTKVMRWERYWHGDRSFIKPEDYPELSLTTVSTHDSTPLRLWWKEGGEDVQAYAACKGWSPDAPLSDDQIKSILKESHQTKSRFHVNLLQEYFSAVPELRYEKPEQDRINIPGTLLPDNWTYRLKPTIEEWTKNNQLLYDIQNCLS
jgi:4-alpha-glucanotransferase